MVGIGDNGGLSGGPEHRTRARRNRPPRAYVVEEQGAGRRGRRTRGRSALLGAAQARTRATPTRPLKAMVPAMWPAPWPRHLRSAMAFKVFPFPWFVVANASRRACGNGKSAPVPDFTPLISNTLFHEYESLVRRPSVHARCPLTPRERDDLLDAFLGAFVWVRISFRWRPNLRDESDNHLIELAVAGGAMAIVTNNVRDLRSGELVFPDIGIMTPAEFMKSLRKRP